MRNKIPTHLSLALAVLALSPAAASAGSYHVYGCRTPAGTPAPADGWASSRSGGYSHTENACAEGGALKAALDAGAARAANTDYAQWSFSAPSQATIVGATLWRAGDAAGGAASGTTFQTWLAGPSITSSFDGCSFAAGCTAGLGNELSPFSLSNRVEVPPSNLGGKLFVKVSCSGLEGFPCPTTTGDANNYAAALYLYASDITLEQAAGPTAASVGGELAGAPSVSGVAALTFSATDPGAGVWRAQFRLDGQLVQTTPLAEANGRCRDVGAADGLPAFLYTQPCPLSLGADVAFDTTPFANGAHRLVVTVQDAAGNSAPVLDRVITFANPAGGSTGQAAVPAGTPNGSPASAQARLTLAWSGARTSSLAVRYGGAAMLTGRLTTSSGAPISGAQLEATATPSSTGAQPVAITAPRTGADGSFSMPVAPGPSRTLLLAYRAHAGDGASAASAQATLAVAAGLTLSISPRTTSVGRRIRFSGRLIGGPIPATGTLLVLEARSPGGRWIKFDVVRSDRRGRYVAWYRFRLPGPARYQFRVLAEPQGAYPYAAGASPIVGVRER